jgi:hypothetical protein
MHWSLSLLTLLWLAATRLALEALLALRCARRTQSGPGIPCQSGESRARCPPGSPEAIAVPPS